VTAETTGRKSATAMSRDSAVIFFEKILLYLKSGKINKKRSAGKTLVVLSALMLIERV